VLCFVLVIVNSMVQERTEKHPLPQSCSVSGCDGVVCGCLCVYSFSVTVDKERETKANMTE